MEHAKGGENAVAMWGPGMLWPSSLTRPLGFSRLGPLHHDGAQIREVGTNLADTTNRAFQSHVRHDEHYNLSQARSR